MNSSDDQNNLTHSKKLGNVQFKIFCQSQPQTSNLIFSIQKYLEGYPQFYLNSILTINKGRSIQTIQSYLKRELKQLKQEKSFYQIIVGCLSARENCLSKISHHLLRAQKILSLFPKSYPSQTLHHSAYLQYVDKQGYSPLQVDQTIQNSINLISTLFIDMARLRDISIYVVEKIHQWRIRLERWADRCNQYREYFFYHNSTNVYQIIMNDTKFIYDGILSQYIQIKSKNDPFFIRNVIQIQEKQNKTVLEKYFVQILYPKTQQLIAKSIKSYQMLTYQYQPEINNIYREEQLLIQNYLSLQKNSQNFEPIYDIPQNTLEWQDHMKRQKKILKDRFNAKGWIFGKSLHQPTRHRVKQIIQRHSHKLTFIKPFNISNYGQKSSLALAYVANKNIEPVKQILHQKQKQVNKIYRSQSTRQIKQPKFRQRKLSPLKKGYKSQDDAYKSNNLRPYQSLSKLNPIIMEDPKEQDEMTPTSKGKANFQSKFISQSDNQVILDKKLGFNKEKQSVITRKNKFIFNTFSPSQSHSNFSSPRKLQKILNLKQQNLNLKQQNLKQIINQKQKQKSQKNQKNEKDHNTDFDKISVQSGQQKIQFGDFLQNFRPDTNLANKKAQQKLKALQATRKKISSIKDMVQGNKIRSPYHIKLSSLKIDKKKQKLKKSNQSLQKSNKSLKQANYLSEYKKVQDTAMVQSKQIVFSRQQIQVKQKSVPLDLISSYLNHIFNQLHSSSKKFSQFNKQSILSKLNDPYSHSIIFDICTKQALVGQVILAQQLSKDKKLKYQIMFYNVNKFQLVATAILKLIQMLLMTTPCQQIICPLIKDKLDLVSIHFVQLLENAFRTKTDPFATHTILQKKKTYDKDSDIYQRLNIFECKSKKSHQLKISKLLMSNYRSLKFQCKCLVLSSNFRMRSKTAEKSIISKYSLTSLGYMYCKILQKILTKFHLKQLKMASASLVQDQQSKNLLKQNLFLRTQITVLNDYIKDQVQDEIVQLTKFQNMNQVLTYLQYKQYNKHFHFDFLQESRFILNHQLYLSEIDIDLSLQFMIKMSANCMILCNNHNFKVKTVQPNEVNKQKCLMVPTTNPNIELLILDGSEYCRSPYQMDLFSYLCLYEQTIISRYKQIEVKQIVLPLINKQSTNSNTVKMFDGLYGLFPEKEFYSTHMFTCSNHWQTYFANAVLSQIDTNATFFQYPLIIGFIHTKAKRILTAFLLQDQNKVQT